MTRTASDLVGRAKNTLVLLEYNRPTTCSTGRTTSLLNWVSYLPSWRHGNWFCGPIFLILAAIFGSMRSMRAPIFVAQLARLFKTDFLVSLLHGTITGDCLASASFLQEAFSPDGAWDFSGVHMRSIALREV
jgi:hypothetical protein